MLAEGLVRDDPRHEKVFVERFNRWLQGAHATMSEELKAEHSPGCQRPFDGLTRHVGNRSGAGYLQYPPPDAALQTHVEPLFLRDLFLVAAERQGDKAAGQCLSDMATTSANRAAAKFQGDCRRLVAEEGPGHLWAASGDGGRHEENGESGRERSRIESYLGISPLEAWMFITHYNLGRDCTRQRRRMVAIGPRVDDEDGDETAHRDVPSQMTLTPDDWEFARRYYKKIQQELDLAIKNLADNKNENQDTRLHKVAWLWLYGRFRKSEVAGILTVSRAAVSQQVTAIGKHIRKRLEATAEEIVQRIEDIGTRSDQATKPDKISVEHVQDLLWTVVSKDAGYFFEPLLFQFVLDAYRALLRDRPDLLCLARLHWMQNVPRQELAERICEFTDSPPQVDRLLLELLFWHDRVTQAAAEMVEKECGVAARTMYGWIRPLIPQWLGDVDGSGPANDAD